MLRRALRGQFPKETQIGPVLALAVVAPQLVQVLPG